MLKNITRLVHTIEDKAYEFTCENDAQIQHVKEAIFQFLKEVGQIEDQIKQAQEILKQQQSIEQSKISEQQVKIPLTETQVEA